MFNWCGYQFVVQYMQHRADARQKAQISQGNYASTQLIELKKQLNLPYSTSWAGWEDAEGTVEIDGFIYSYVQRKIEDGFLHVRCLPHTERQMLINARDQFTKLALSLEQGADKQSSDKAPVSIKTFIGDYDDQLSIHFSVPAVNGLPARFAEMEEPVLTGSHPSDTPPPEARV